MGTLPSRVGCMNISILHISAVVLLILRAKYHCIAMGVFTSSQVRTIYAMQSRFFHDDFQIGGCHDQVVLFR